MVAVVTGASGDIGRAIALEFAAAGADVVVHGRRQEAAAEVAAKVEELGRRAKVILLDLAEPSSHQTLVQAAWDWQQGVHIWVNNAGADVLTGEAARWSFERKLEELWKVDVLATVNLSRLIGEKLHQQTLHGHAPAGVILNIGWDQAAHGMAGDSGQMFGCIKGAVMSFTQSLAQSLAPHVRANCLAPGWIKTSWGERASDYWQERARLESLAGRWGTPEDVARAARFLASPAAEFITGQIINVNGGYRYGKS
ncbi:MAG: SDR family NAD(P)-dependent oxidoreductase [Pirellulaceae bacterium]